MSKVKLLFYTELWANAGIESVIMSLFRNFDRDRIQVDVMASQNISDFHDEEIKKLGGNKIITLKEKYNSPARRMIANQEEFKKMLSERRMTVEEFVKIRSISSSSLFYYTFNQIYQKKLFGT